MRTPLLVCIVPMLAFFWYVVLTHKLDNWTVAAVSVASAAIALYMSVRDEVPEHIGHWQRGAEGERKTEKALRKLERAGWTIEHDIQREGRGNIDHIVQGPAGVFLLETKNLSGTITVQDGMLQAQPFDDPEGIYHHRGLAERVRGQAADVSARLFADTGRRTWVTAVVVIWGRFDQGIVEGDRVTYVAGDRLALWLQARA